MTTNVNTYDIKLPPLPDNDAIEESVYVHTRAFIPLVTYDAIRHMMQDYAYSAIEPYQKRIAELESQLEASTVDKLLEIEEMKTETILTDAEIIAIGHQARAIEGGENGYILPVTFARAIEQAVLQSTEKMRMAKSNDITENLDFDPDVAITLAERTLNVEITEPLAEDIVQFSRKLYEIYTQE